MDLGSDSFRDDCLFQAEEFKGSTIIGRLGKLCKLSSAILAFGQRRLEIADASETCIVVFGKHFFRLTAIFEAKCCQR